MQNHELRLKNRLENKYKEKRKLSDEANTCGCVREQREEGLSLQPLLIFLSCPYTKQ
jgi:hypothetical protein